MDSSRRLLDLPRRITGIYEDPDFHREGQVTDVGRAALRKALKAALRDIESLDLAAELKAYGACRSPEEPGWWLW